MSMKRLAILSAIHNDGRLNATEMNPTPGSPPAPVHGVNVMLGGAMLSGIILVIFIMCYCCHKTNRKCQSNLPSYWRDPALSMEIYTVEAAQNWLVSEELSYDLQQQDTPGPPPAYDAVVPLTKVSSSKEDETGLPSYETAIQHLHYENTNNAFQPLGLFTANRGNSIIDTVSHKVDESDLESGGLPASRNSYDTAYPSTPSSFDNTVRPSIQCGYEFAGTRRWSGSGFECAGNLVGTVRPSSGSSYENGSRRIRTVHTLGLGSGWGSDVSQFNSESFAKVRSLGHL